MSKTNEEPQVFTALYRKYRPSEFDQVTGQSHIVGILKEEVKKEQPNHAFLFAGSRGTGKTTIARIFAKHIGTSPEDIYEIDAASNTSVEDIRTLNEAVYTLPLNSKFKVYILDEVHMLSKSAFNAFLKTLEEPPKHVIFILATTELHKIPETIISRCQVFNFKKPTITTLADVVRRVVASEGYKFEEKVGSISLAEIIAQAGRGSFRDLHTHVQKVITIATTNKNVINYDVIMKAIGLSTQDAVEKLSAVFLSSKEGIKEGLEIIGTVSESSADIELFTDSVIMQIRNEMLMKPETRALGLKALESLLAVKDYIHKTSIPTLPLELALYRFFGVK